MANLTQSQITKANIDAKHAADHEQGSALFFVVIALCWIPALFFGPVNWVKMTWKIGAPVTALAVVCTVAAVDNKKKLTEQIGREKLQAQGLKEF